MSLIKDDAKKHLLLEDVKGIKLTSDERRYIEENFEVLIKKDKKIKLNFDKFQIEKALIDRKSKESKKVFELFKMGL